MKYIPLNNFIFSVKLTSTYLHYVSNVSGLSMFVVYMDHKFDEQIYKIHLGKTFVENIIWKDRRQQ